MILTAYGLSLFSGLIYSLVSGVTVMPLSQITGALVVGSCLALYFQKDNIVFNCTKTLKSKRIYQTFFIILLGFSISNIAVNVVSVLPTLTQTELKWLQKREHKVLHPRFWAQGWLID